MYRERKTAVLNLTLAGATDSEARALDTQREYQFALRIGDEECEGGLFYSPFGDDRWNAVALAMCELPEKDVKDKRRGYEKVYGAGVQLYDALCDRSRALKTFLADESGPRRLVIRSNRPEIHRLPWEAMIDEDRELLAHRDISIVRSIGAFDPKPWVFGSGPDQSGKPLKISGIFGPDAEGLSFQALKELAESAAKQTDSGLTITTTKEKTLRQDWFDELQAEIIHLEAHGDLRGNVQMPDWFNTDDPIALAERLRAREVVLLWSCYSAMIHSWGKSLAMRLHERGAKFVLSFSTPLRYETSATIARHFYTSVFSARDAIDPESAIVEQRKRLYHEDLMTCDWASMTLWLRVPIDLSAAVLSGPRLPEGQWVDDAAREMLFKNRLKNKVAPGQAVLLSKQRFDGPMPYGMVATYRGAAVHLRGRSGLENTEIFEKLEVEPADLKSHAGDRFIVLLETLASYPRSLLVWSGVTRSEVLLVDLLSAEIPKALDVVLISPDDIQASPKILLAKDDAGVVHEETAAAQPTPMSELERLWQLAETDPFAESAALWDKLNPESEHWDKETKIRFQITGYSALIRAVPERAEKCIEEVENLNEVEGLLLRGNFLHRNAFYPEAQRTYEKAAEAAAGPRDKARAWLELAYLFSEQRGALSEDYYRRALDLLEKVEGGDRDWRWSSALGRVLRDLADHLIANSENAPGEECDRYLKRAMAIHAIDDRLNQVGAVLRTQGALARKRQQWPRAEAALLHAASIFTAIGNQSGWITTVQRLAELSCSRNQPEQGLAILRSALEKLKAEHPGRFKKEKATLALQLAGIYWSLGDFGQATTHCEFSLANLPEELRKERVEAETMHSFLQSLHAS